jgi:predicted deacetylase
MTKARYLFRMDDITPTMDWGRFWALLRLFQRNRVKPLLGIVPDNKDPKLDIQKAEPQFWDTMCLLRERGLVELAQHGYQHILSPRLERALVSHRRGPNADRSEFVGFSFQDQVDRILQGREILKRHGLVTDNWFSPNHSFDLTTLNALKTTGFKAVSDGIALFPHTFRGLVFIPQQLWRPMWAPTGVFTVCLHSNEITNQEIQAIRQFLRTPASITSFEAEVRAYRHRKLDGIKNSLFKGLYGGVREVREVFRRRSPRSRATPTIQPPQPTPMPMDRGSISSI